MKDRERCYYLAKRYGYAYDRVMSAMKHQEPVYPHAIKDDFISMLDDDYPSSFRDLDSPPVCVCYRGDKSLLQAPRKIAVIGSRQPNEYGAWFLAELMKRLDKDIVIVSGLARGIDGMAHQSAIRWGLKTIGVIGSGLAYTYPAEHRALFDVMGSHHLIISEYQYHEPIRRHHFPARNRLIAALGDVLIVVASKVKSGSATTVKAALDLGKEIYCVPHRLTDELGAGNHLLIQEGANIIYDIDELCRDLNKRNKLTNHKIPLR